MSILSTRQVDGWRVDLWGTYGRVECQTLCKRSYVALGRVPFSRGDDFSLNLGRDEDDNQCVRVIGIEVAIALGTP